MHGAVLEDMKSKPISDDSFQAFNGLNVGF